MSTKSSIQITQLQKEIEQLKSDQLKYKKLFELSGDALSILNLKTGKFIECNKAAVEMHGVESEENFLNITPGQLSPEFQLCGGKSEDLAKEKIERTLSEGPQIFEWIHQKLDGTTFPCLVSLTPIPIENGILVLAIGRDISKLKDAQKSLENANDQLKVTHHHSKMASIGRLAAGIAHEINNPLTIVTGHIQLIKRLLNSPEINLDEINSKIEKSLLGTERIGQIIKGMRTLARMNTIENATFSPVDAVKSIRNLIEEIYRREGIDIQFSTDCPENLEIRGEIPKFQQCILNLLSNAKDALENRPNPLIEVKCISNDLHYEISVKDNGTGIKEKDIENIFDPFFTTKDVNKGTGIGLAITYTLTTEMNGTINVKSKEDEYSMFTLSFPIQQ